jgi:hypothetical protein
MKHVADLQVSQRVLAAHVCQRSDEIHVEQVVEALATRRAAASRTTSCSSCTSIILHTTRTSPNQTSINGGVQSNGHTCSAHAVALAAASNGCMTAAANKTAARQATRQPLLFQQPIQASS